MCSSTGCRASIGYVSSLLRSINLYTVCQKGCRYIFAGNFTICRPIFKNILSADSVVTRSTETAPTSAKARFDTIAIRIRIRIRVCIRDPDRHQNLIICLLAYYQPFLKISCKSVRKFLRKVANRQTDKQRRKHHLLGGGKYSLK